MDELTLIARYGKIHGLSYGEVSLMLAQGQLTYEQIGIARKPKKAESKPEPKKKGRKPKHEETE